METSRILFNCTVAVTYKKSIIIITREINDSHKSEKDHIHFESFDETESAQHQEYISEYEPGYYHCGVWLVYETIHYAGGQDGTEYDSYFEFDDLVNK